MTDYQLRVVEEHRALMVKIVALQDFLCHREFDLDPKERQRLINQNTAMIDYEDALRARIEAFE